MTVRGESPCGTHPMTRDELANRLMALAQTAIGAASDVRCGVFAASRLALLYDRMIDASPAIDAVIEQDRTREAEARDRRAAWEEKQHRNREAARAARNARAREKRARKSDDGLTVGQRARAKIAKESGVPYTSGVARARTGAPR